MQVLLSGGRRGKPISLRTMWSFGRGRSLSPQSGPGSPQYTQTDREQTHVYLSLGRVALMESVICGRVALGIKRLFFLTTQGDPDILLIIVGWLCLAVSMEADQGSLAFVRGILIGLGAETSQSGWFMYKELGLNYGIELLGWGGVVQKHTIVCGSMPRPVDIVMTMTKCVPLATVDYKLLAYFQSVQKGKLIKERKSFVFYPRQSQVHSFLLADDL